ncbi:MULTISPECIES: ATP-grasp domain-containing protein [Streptomyces]|uniref:ATP-grasp domain-containing protein n=1 Tax=Streptomyces TaxID=1883 RepID=UPI00345BF3A0
MADRADHAEHIVIVEALTSGTGLRLVEAAVRRAGRVTFITRDKGRYANDPLRHLLDGGPVEVHVRETRSTEELTELFQTLLGGGEFTLIAPNEQYLLPAATAAEKLGIPFLPTASVRLTQDKHAFRQACAAVSVPAPRSTAAPDVDSALAAAEATGYPVVLKPSIGTGSYGVVSAADADELRWHFPEVRDESDGQDGVPLVEEFLIGPVVSAEVLYSGGVPHVLGISDRIMSELPYFMELAIRFPVDLSPEAHEQIERICADLARLMAYENGPAHIEFTLTAEGPKVVEFNPRFAGRNVSTMVSAALDWNVFDGVIASYLGEPVNAPAPVGAAAEQALYAKRGGRFEDVAGRELADRVPGLRDIRITARAGDVLPDAKDQRSEYGTLWCTGATADEAGIRAASAAGYLRPVFGDEA